MAAQTGTGKTLAYSLPIIHRLKQDEIGAETQMTLPHRPRALILVPSRELVVQVVKETLKPFHYEVPLKFGGLYPNQSHKIEEERLDNGLDVVVATMDRL